MSSLKIPQSQVITLCGSSRFEQHFHAWNKTLTLDGHTVFSLSVFPSHEKLREWYTKEEKECLDRVHKRKILMSDIVAVISINGYVGESTREGIRFSKANKRPVYIVGDVNGKY